MKTLTIFTPTYNRAEKLKNLYNSLCKQKNQDFLWYIVDDGSSDDSNKLINNWISEGKIQIILFRQKNKGKMAAHNTGVKNCTTEFFMCVDSDECMVENAVDEILNNIDNIKSNNVAGMLAYKRITNKDVDSSLFESGDFSTLNNLYNLGFRGEIGIIFKTDVVKNYLFPEIEGEKFITEKIVYDLIDEKYTYFLLKVPLISTEYYCDGYTKNMARILVENPKGCALYYNQLLKLFQYNFKKKITYTMLYIIYSRLGKNKKIYMNSNCKNVAVYFVSLLLSFVYSPKIKKSAQKS